MLATSVSRWVLFIYIVVLSRLVRDANVMRLYGTRLLICEKNVGRLKYAFNQLQLQFMPSEYRPPTETIEDMVSSVLNRDVT